ncbi:unnamed protein product [Ectocarpus sp. 8 AP-2014]
MNRVTRVLRPIGRLSKHESSLANSSGARMAAGPREGKDGSKRGDICSM